MLSLSPSNKPPLGLAPSSEGETKNKYSSAYSKLYSVGLLKFKRNSDFSFFLSLVKIVYHFFAVLFYLYIIGVYACKFIIPLCIKLPSRPLRTKFLIFSYFTYSKKNIIS